MVSEARFVRLLHLSDSAIPTGSFAYSSGLESAIEFGFIQSMTDFYSYLQAFLQQAVSMEYPFMNSCFGLAAPEWGTELKEMVETYEAMLLLPTLHKSSLAQGKNWLRLLHSFYPDKGINELIVWFEKQNLPLHYTLVLALSLKKLSFTLKEVKLFYLHATLRDQVSAAIRLGFMGAMEGNQLQHFFYELFDELNQDDPAVPYQEAYRSGLLIDVAQAYHQDVYSRLFQN